MQRVRIGLLGVLLVAACQTRPPTAAAPRDARAEARTLLEGAGPQVNCHADVDCTVGHVRAACVLGACFGALSAEERPVRLTMLERLRKADAAVRVEAWPQLRPLLTAASPNLQLAAVRSEEHTSELSHT